MGRKHVDLLKLIKFVKENHFFGDSFRKYDVTTAELTMGQWAMGHMGLQNLKGHMGHG
jgi:hypothetical protein